MQNKGVYRSRFLLKDGLMTWSTAFFFVLFGASHFRLLDAARAQWIISFLSFNDQESYWDNQCHPAIQPHVLSIFVCWARHSVEGSLFSSFPPSTLSCFQVLLPYTSIYSSQTPYLPLPCTFQDIWTRKPVPTSTSLRSKLKQPPDSTP